MAALTWLTVSWAHKGRPGVIGAAAGAVAGLFATTAINSAGGDGLFFGNPGQLRIQLLAVAATRVYAGGMTFVILKLIDLVIGLRVEQKEEALGLDVGQHGELAYQLT